jgi:hypothetical protein
MILDDLVSRRNYRKKLLREGAINADLRHCQGSGRVVANPDIDPIFELRAACFHLKQRSPEVSISVFCHGATTILLNAQG